MTKKPFDHRNIDQTSLYDMCNALYWLQKNGAHQDGGGPLNRPFKLLFTQNADRSGLLAKFVDAGVDPEWTANSEEFQNWLKASADWLDLPKEDL